MNRLDDLELSNLHPKKAFILAVLDKEMRLSFAKRVRSTLPEKMHSMIPERLDADNSPDFKYENPRMYIHYTSVNVTDFEM
jgi:nuclear cap-binding protein subunit 1